MDYILLSGIILVTIIIIIVAYRLGRSLGSSRSMEIQNKEHDSRYLREILSRDQQIHSLQSSIDNLNGLNHRYLSFMIKVPTIVQRMNSTLSTEEVNTSVIQLVSDIIHTKKVELYYLDSTDNVLRTLSSSEHGANREISYAIGEGMIGMAAQQRMIKLKKQNVNKISAQTRDGKQEDSQFWMTVPIVFKERLLGVIGIGEVSQPVGNESDIMKMIADIAAVALINQAMLGEAKEKANTDSLTGLNNRYYFLQMAQNYVEKSIRERTPISIFLFDIDNFKHYNDTNGHDEGDRLLRELSDLVRTVTRKNSVLVRYGGEEFIVMLQDISKEDTFIYAERLREKIAAYPFANREKQPLGCVSVSGGIASFPVDADTIFKVIHLADVALYQAKTRGRNRIVIHTAVYLSDHETGYDNTSMKSDMEPYKFVE